MKNNNKEGVHVKRLMILLPVLNEAEGLDVILKTIPYEALEKKGWGAEVLIVDGKSTDASRQIGIDAGCNVIVQPSRGKGEAVRVGIDHAIRNTYDAVVMFDADQTYSPNDMLPMLEQLLPGHVVVGNRLNSLMTKDAMSPLNWIGNHILTWSAVILHGLEIHDVCSGYWLFDRQALLRMNLNSMDFEIEAEMYAQCAISGIPLANIPVSYGARIGEAKLGSLRDGSSILRKLLVRKLFPLPVEEELGDGKLAFEPNH
ncbi:MAG: hypothetical protein CMB70_04805 [Euryarchaeota archaeon]|nr:hypothetical protein [Euryarchaeota archaeon]|tara:strand:- start:9045 stop:9818 length:774 start_codon:yes stop_codon:yes gene_type:complete